VVDIEVLPSERLLGLFLNVSIVAKQDCQKSIFLHASILTAKLPTPRGVKSVKSGVFLLDCGVNYPKYGSTFHILHLPTWGSTPQPPHILQTAPARLLSHFQHLRTTVKARATGLIARWLSYIADMSKPYYCYYRRARLPTHHTPCSIIVADPLPSIHRNTRPKHRENF